MHLKKSRIMSTPLLSICIPTRDRVEILKKTLDSIFTSSTVSLDEYEVIVSDNSDNDDVQKALENYRSYPNFRYHRSEKKGFLNSINALELGNGKLLKLHNNYTMFSMNSLEKLIAFTKDNLAQKPLIFFAQGELGSITIKSHDAFDDFLMDVSFWITWSSGFSIWKEDFLKLKDKEVNNMFPHTSLLLFQNKKEKYVINNFKYFNNQHIPGKGGYNLFNVFAVVFLNMVYALKSSRDIRHQTFEKIKHDLYYFLIPWYYNTKIAKNDYTYDLTDIKSSVCTYYTELEYKKLVVLAYLYVLKKAWNRIKGFFA